MSKCLMIAAGGTGGHIFPAIAVAQLLQQQGWRIEWLGSAGGLEERLVPMHQLPLHLLPVTGLRGKSPLTLLLAPWRIAKSVWLARKLIKSARVDVVLGMGGFASGPGGMAAKICGVPLVLHEQNAIAGMTNRFLARLANTVLAAFPNAFPAPITAEVVGNPVRKNILSRVAQAINSQLNILIVGGSRGAAALNNVMPEVVASLPDTDLHIWHQTGKGHLESTQQRYFDTLTASRLQCVQISEFIDDMAEAYQWADLVICRAGALTVSELAMAGKPAIFVPYPHAVDDHQFYNARYLADQDASWIVRQGPELRAALTSRLQTLITHRDVLTHAAEKALTLAKPDAGEKVAQACARLAQGALT